MDVEQRPPYQQQIPDEDWERTPLSVKQLVESQSERLGQLEERLGQLEQQLAELQDQNQLLKEQKNRTSVNSSQPPSSDPPTTPKRQQKRKSSKKSVRHSPGCAIRATTRTERPTGSSGA